MAKEERRKYQDKMTLCFRNQEIPKKVSGAYHFFRNSKKNEYKQDYPECDKKVIQKLMIRDWYMMSKSEREPYEKMRKDDLDRYHKELVAKGIKPKF